jgi:Holliday junction DNA helicase RuvB
MGKAALARVIRKAVGAKAMVLSGIATGHAGDLAGLLTQLDKGDVLFIEDVHALERPAAKALCQPMRDFRMGIVIDKGPHAKSLQLQLPAFTLIATAPRRERIPQALLASFQVVEELNAYSETELAAIASRFGELLGISLHAGAAERIASADCSSPRDVLHRVRHVRDFVNVNSVSAHVTPSVAAEALTMLGNTQPARPTARVSGAPPANSDPLKRRYQVFVSSTFEDLQEERRYAMQALLETKCIPTGMELFPAGAKINGS